MTLTNSGHLPVFPKLVKLRPLLQSDPEVTSYYGLGKQLGNRKHPAPHIAWESICATSEGSILLQSIFKKP